MNLFSMLRKNESPEIEVVFAGGMGTQILQASVYFDLEQQGVPVYADLGYYSRPVHIAQPGVKGDLSHWPWQLDQYGITHATFRTKSSTDKLKRLADGDELVSSAITALSKPSIREKFTVKPDIASGFLSPTIAHNAVCIHIRRGDYVNVASHLMADELFASIGKKFSGLCSQAVILSDSPVDSNLRTLMQQHFSDITFLDHLDPLSSHFIMRQARILVCSNSTFSLTAGLLNETGLVVIPKKWYGENEKNIEQKISAMCDFQIITH